MSILLNLNAFKNIKELKNWNSMWLMTVTRSLHSWYEFLWSFDMFQIFHSNRSSKHHCILCPVFHRLDACVSSLQPFLQVHMRDIHSHHTCVLCNSWGLLDRESQGNRQVGHCSKNKDRCSILQSAHLYHKSLHQAEWRLGLTCQSKRAVQQGSLENGSRCFLPRVLLSLLISL